MSSRYRNEDDRLHGAEKHLHGIQAHLQDYVDLWSLEEFEGVTPATIRELASHLLNEIPEILGTPLEQRGHREQKSTGPFALRQGTPFPRFSPRNLQSLIFL